MTLGFAQITNDAKATIHQILEYEEYFDKFFITVADKDKTEFHKLKKFAENYTKKTIKVKYFPWVKSFGKARIANQAMVTTDYWFWMDTDDTVDHPELLKPLVQQMATQEIDMLFMTYDYYQNPSGEAQADHWRERIIRTKCSAKWSDVVCHETVDALNQRCERTKNVTVSHHKSVPDMEKTVDRNYELLINDWNDHKDPRTAYYLGMTMMTKGKYKEAIEYFLYLIEEGGWDEQKITAWCAISDCYLFTQQYDKALVATNMAIHMNPAAPDPWYQKVIIYSTTQDYAKAVEFAHIALTKQPDPNTMQLVDPTKYSYKGQFLAAQAYLFSGRIKEGFELYKKVREAAPHFLEEAISISKVDWNKIFEEAMVDEKAIEYIKFLTQYNEHYDGKITKLFESLPKRIVSDARLNSERIKAFPPKKWDKNTIAYYCGPSIAPWGPDMMENGIGGSEEAVIYLSRELAKLGWEVTVFCDREEEYKDEFAEFPDVENQFKFVTYKPWTELNPFDTFDVFIASRQPANVNGVKARMTILDMHDVNAEDQVNAAAEKVDKIFVKSKWHRNCYPKIPDDKFEIIGNAIVEGQFK